MRESKRADFDNHASYRPLILVKLFKFYVKQPNPCDIYAIKAKLIADNLLK